MLERVLFAAGVGVMGLIAYRGLLALQQRRVTRQARSAPIADRAALLVFTSPTCAPCKLQQLPIVERLMIDWHTRIAVRVIDVMDQPAVAQQFGVWSLPTTIVLKADGSVVSINQGVTPEHKLRAQFQRATDEAIFAP